MKFNHKELNEVMKGHRESDIYDCVSRIMSLPASCAPKCRNAFISAVWRMQRAPQSDENDTMIKTTFTGLRLLWWMSLLIKFDPALFEKPPIRVKGGDVKERLKHSTVQSSEINNVHFTSRGKVVGSSGKNLFIST